MKKTRNAKLIKAKEQSRKHYLDNFKRQNYRIRRPRFVEPNGEIFGRPVELLERVLDRVQRDVLVLELSRVLGPVRYKILGFPLL